LELAIVELVILHKFTYNAFRGRFRSIKSQKPELVLVHR